MDQRRLIKRVRKLAAELSDKRSGAIDVDFLGEHGTFWDLPYDDPPALLTGGRADVVDLVVGALSEVPPRSVLLVGPHGAGKSALARAAVGRIAPRLVFQAAASRVGAGAIYTGELEGRVKDVVDALRGKRIVWHLPDLEAALYTGRHTQSRHGMLDFLLPSLLAGEDRDSRRGRAGGC